MATRYFPPVLLAGGITFILFWVMTALIAIEELEIVVEPITHISMAHVRPEEPLETKVRKKPERPEVPEEPTHTTIPTTDPHGARFPALRDPRSMGPAVARGQIPIDLEPADGDAVAMVRVAPRYPERALARGIEGRVLIEFTIATSGNVRDARVIAAEPSDIFNRSALDAVRQWRYNPKIVNGRPVERKGMRISIPFRRGSNESG
jgi:protein TonB